MSSTAEAIETMTREKAAAYVSQFVFHPQGNRLEVGMEGFSVGQSLAFFSALKELGLNDGDAHVVTQQGGTGLTGALVKVHESRVDMDKPYSPDDRNRENRAVSITLTQGGIRKIFMGGVENSLIQHIADEQQWKRPRSLKEAARASGGAGGRSRDEE